MPGTSTGIATDEIEVISTGVISTDEITIILARLKRVKGLEISLGLILLLESLKISSQQYSELESSFSKAQYEKYVIELREILQKIRDNPNYKKQFESNSESHDRLNMRSKILAKSLLPLCGFVWLSVAAVMVGATIIIPISFLVIGIVFAAALFCFHLHSKYKENQLVSEKNKADLTDAIGKLDKIISEIDKAESIKVNDVVSSDNTDDIITTDTATNSNQVIKEISDTKPEVSVSRNSYYYWLDTAYLNAAGNRPNNGSSCFDQDVLRSNEAIYLKCTPRASTQAR
jgi:hypothetical protein